MKEVVLIVGYNAAGKTTLVKEFTDAGFNRLNRDEAGGKVDDLVKPARQILEAGGDTVGVVLDNTFPTVESRAPFIQLAKDVGAQARCVWLATSFEDAQLNACLRMIRRMGRLLDPSELKKSKDPNIFRPAAIFSYKKKFKKPTEAEGFVKVEKREFVRVWESKYKNKAIILDYDDTLRRSTGPKQWPEQPDHVEVLPNRAAVLKRYQREGYLLLGASNQSAVAKGLSMEMAVACFDRTNELLGVDIDYLFCPHNVPPVECYCRKPHPGIGAHFIEKHKLNPALCIMVGDQTSDKTFAKRCGFQYQDAEGFFKA